MEQKKKREDDHKSYKIYSFDRIDRNKIWLFGVEGGWKAGLFFLERLFFDGLISMNLQANSNEAALVDFRRNGRWKERNDGEYCVMEINM